MAALQDLGSETGRQVLTGRQSGRQSQTPNGIVKVVTDKGWLRLRWTHLGKRYALTLGLPNYTVNRTFAQQKAHQIELDTVSGHFDKTLKRYKSEAVLKRGLVSVVELFQQFTQEKSKSVYHQPWLMASMALMVSFGGMFYIMQAEAGLEPTMSVVTLNSALDIPL